MNSSAHETHFCTACSKISMIPITPDTQKVSRALSHAKRPYSRCESRSRPINTGFFKHFIQHHSDCTAQDVASDGADIQYHAAMLSAAFYIYFCRRLRNKYEAWYEIRTYSNAVPASIKFYFAHFSLNECWHVADKHSNFRRADGTLGADCDCLH